MITNLQFLRAFAALCVVLMHALDNARVYGLPANRLSFLEGWGHGGVDLFFVISGFIILHTQLRTRRSVYSFLKTRFLRIVPLYWLLTSLVVCIYLVAPNLFRESIITWHWVWTSAIFLSAALHGTLPVISVGWSLEWEALFYLIFGLSLVCRNKLCSFLSVTFLLLVLAPLSPGGILIEFLAGMAIALLYERDKLDPRWGKFLLFMGATAFLLGIIPELRGWVGNRVLMWGLPSLAMVFGAVAMTQVNFKLGKLLGDASYSIYLAQVFSIPGFFTALNQLGLKPPSDVMVITCVLISALSGVLVYLMIEKPMLRLSRRAIKVSNHSNSVNSPYEQRR